MTRVIMIIIGIINILFVIVYQFYLLLTDYHQNNINPATRQLCVILLIDIVIIIITMCCYC